MSIDEAYNKADALERLLLQRLSDIVQVAALDLAADIANRVIETGEAADGARFTPYSEKPLPAFFYLNRSANTAGEAKVKQAIKKKEPVSYKQFRGFNNRPVDIKNFSFRNLMWKAFGTKSVQSSGGILVVTLGMNNPEAAKKLEYNNKREGKNIIEPSPDELKRLKARIIAEILKYNG